MCAQVFGLDPEGRGLLKSPTGVGDGLLPLTGGGHTGGWMAGDRHMPGTSGWRGSGLWQQGEESRPGGPEMPLCAYRYVRSFLERECAHIHKDNAKRKREIAKDHTKFSCQEPAFF